MSRPPPGPDRARLTITQDLRHAVPETARRSGTHSRLLSLLTDAPKSGLDSWDGGYSARKRSLKTTETSYRIGTIRAVCGSPVQHLASPFLAIGQAKHANPLVLLDELEKAGTRSDYGRLWDTRRAPRPRPPARGRCPLGRPARRHNLINPCSWPSELRQTPKTVRLWTNLPNAVYPALTVCRHCPSPFLLTAAFHDR
jgi:hypothetical protein